jgi:hypothetical protein
MRLGQTLGYVQLRPRSRTGLEFCQSFSVQDVPDDISPRIGKSTLLRWPARPNRSGLSSTEVDV